MGKKIIILGADFSANAIDGPQPYVSENLITIDLSHGSNIPPIYELRGSAYTKNATGYSGWGTQGEVEIPDVAKFIKGKATFYNASGLMIPSVVFLDASKQVITSFVPTEVTTIGRLTDSFVGEYIGVSIPEGAKYIVPQCFTGSAPTRGDYVTDQSLYMYGW